MYTSSTGRTVILHRQAEDSSYRYLRKVVSEVPAITSVTTLSFDVHSRRSLAVSIIFERRTRKDFRNLNRAEAMAARVTNGTSYSTGTVTVFSLAKSFKEVVSNTTSTTRRRTATTTNAVIAYETVTINILVEAHLTCENFNLYTSPCLGSAPCLPSVDDPKPNPDIAGIGVCIPHSRCFTGNANGAKILLALFITACAVLIFALVAYTGGFLPTHFLRRIVRRIFRARSRREHFPWRTVIENIMLALSDEQLIRAFALLVAGYYEMINNDLPVSNWQIVV